ncbi:4-hydroxy-tetrahydrodipicolinate synthase [Anseongella ginsenosidimutans]|uniref:4-hydroxy-tetrahydrodipicolinate synthase n=1 Tax=Anseongella ginsenosidimutans TaxID=496056 RepID=A0A4R3L0F3_9SPHI|nr:4-hydroxy-tetrahydrodipicolinate synthase [Anseongella ginsenosidimutans]QEC50966.1 4-hydroxy-tetrahydrodipicolinate synthase [Anseongella ginsenosidimutans]TCS90390.1 4-hydroxy-tetrahydrodipicolinate synthase [Anseongella ginsenosidimutans]
MTEQLKGTGVALVTPFDQDGNIDFDSLRKLINHIIDNQAEFLVPLGTTGESATLSKEEKKRVFDFVAEVTAGRAPLVAGIGGNNTAELLDCLRAFDHTAYTAILSVSPYYNKPSQEGLFQHFKMLASESPLPLIIYNIPGRTGSNITAETTLRLAEVPNISGVKEASANFEQFMEIIRHMPPDFCFLSGDDGLALPIIALGGHGVISVAGNAFPKDVSDMVRHCLRGDFAEARKLHYKLAALIPLLFEEGNPAGIKAFLRELSICGDTLRLPLVRPGNVLREKISKAVENY